MKTIKLITTLIITIPLLFTSCKKEDDTSPTTSTSSTTTTTASSDYFFSATIAGNVVQFLDLQNGYGCGAGQDGAGGTGYEVFNSTILQEPFSTKNMAGCGITKIFIGTASYEITELEYANIVSVKSYSYGIREDLGNTDSSATDGAVVFYVDNNEVYWATDLGSGNQSGSTFSITEHKVNNDGYSTNITRYAFSCTLYNESGESQTLTNGEVHGRSVLPYSSL